MSSELQPGTMVRLKSGTEGWIKGQVVEYFDIIPSVGGVLYTGPGYKVYILEGKHKGQTLRMASNYVEPLGEYPRKTVEPYRKETPLEKWEKQCRMLEGKK